MRNKAFINPERVVNRSNPNEYVFEGRSLAMKAAHKPIASALESKSIWAESEIKLNEFAKIP